MGCYDPDTNTLYEFGGSCSDRRIDDFYLSLPLETFDNLDVKRVIRMSRYSLARFNINELPDISEEYKTILVNLLKNKYG